MPEKKPAFNPVKAGIAGPGRKKGVPNKLSADMKTMLEQALIRAGENVQRKRKTMKGFEPGVAYLTDQAEKNPQAFMGLLRSLLPAKIDLDITLMTRDLVEVLSERREQLAQMRDVTPEERDARH